MPQKRYPADCTVVLCGLKQNITEEEVKAFLKVLKEEVDLISKAHVDRTSEARKIVYLNTRNSAQARDLIAKLNGRREETVGSTANQCYLQAVFKRDLSTVSWSKYTPKTKACEGVVTEKRKTQCVVSGSDKILVDKASFQGDWALIKVGDSLRMEIEQKVGSDQWVAIEAVRIQPQIQASPPKIAAQVPSEGVTSKKESKEALLQTSANADGSTQEPEGRARSYRIQRLLLELVPKILSHAFKQSWERKKGRQWTSASGPALFEMLDSREAMKTLGKKGIQKIEGGNVDSWDITILAKILIDDPGLLQKGSPAALSVQALRKHRNEFVHDLSSESVLTIEDFDAKWKQVTEQLSRIAATTGEEATTIFRKECDRILKEGFDATRAKQLAIELDDVKASLNQVKDDIEALSDQQAKLTRQLSNVATKSELGRVVAMVNNEKKAAPSKIVTMTNGKRFLVTDKSLGSGAMGSVFEGRDLEDNTLVAIKSCPQESNQRGEREAENLQRVRHDNVVGFLGFCNGPEPGAMTIAMELVVGVTYEYYLESIGQLSWKAAAKDVLQIAAGMAAVHAQGIAHRDLKPANIMRKKTGHLVIVDFGLSKALGAGTTVTVNGGGVGSAVYMSPEAIQGQNDRVNASSDVFSIGVIFYEAMTGFLPFGTSDGTGAGDSSGTRSRSSTIMSHYEQGLYSNAVVRSPPLPMCERGQGTAALPVPTAIEDFVCRRALAKSQADRPKDAQEMLHDLEEAMEAAEASEAAPSATAAALPLSQSAREFWAAVSLGDSTAKWALFESGLQTRFPALNDGALRGIKDALDEDRDGVVTDDKFRSFVGAAPLADAITPFIERASATVAATRLKRAATIKADEAGAGSPSAAGAAPAGDAEPAGVHYTLAKTDRVQYVSRGVFSSSKKPGLLVLHGGALTLSKPKTGQERDRFDLTAADLTATAAPREPAAMEVAARGHKGATYHFDSPAACAAWVEAIRRTREWLQSQD